MTLAARSITAFPNAAGIVDTIQPIPSPDVVWATVPNWLNQDQSTAFSVDVRAGYMSGAGAATAVITIVDVSGDSAATLGLTIQTSDDLDTAAGTVASGVFRLKATYNSVEYLSNAFSFSVVVAASPDVLPPTEPLMWSVNPDSSSVMALVVLPPCDPKSPTSDADGMASVEIHRSTDDISYSLLATKSISAGISLQLADNIIGAVSPTPASVQTGADWSLTAEGANSLTGVSDDLLFVAASVVGDFIATCRIPQWVSLATGNPSAVLMARESTAGGSKHFLAGRLSNSGSATIPEFIEAKWRPTTDGNTQFTSSISNVLGDVYFRLRRVGDVFDAYYFQTGFADWTLLSSQTITMTSSVLVGIGASTRLAGSEITIVFEEVCVQNLALITHSDTGLTDNVRYYYKPRGVSL